MWIKSQLAIEQQAIGSAFIPAHKFKTNFVDYYQVTSGDLKGTENYRTKVNALIEEIYHRKQHGLLHPEIEVKNSFEYPSESAQTTK